MQIIDDSAEPEKPEPSPTYTARQDAKRRAGEARSRAAAIAARVGGAVSDYASVKPAEGGYFVDATLWIPDEPGPEPGARSQSAASRAFWNQSEEPNPAERELDDLRRTVRSLAMILGWGNVPSRETLEADLRALQARLRTAEDTRDAAQAEATRQTLKQRDANTARANARATLDSLLQDSGRWSVSFAEGVRFAVSTLRKVL